MVEPPVAATDQVTAHTSGQAEMSDEHDDGPRVVRDLIHGFAPIARHDARVLILGTVPSEMSLQRGEYYAHPRNAFWPVIEALFADGRRLDYAQRVRLAEASHLAVWDVLEAADRIGSLDGAIRKPVPNDFSGFLRDHPAIWSVFFNGAAAERLFRDDVAPSLSRHDELRFQRLPSTSPANAAMSVVDKVKAWRVVLAAVGTNA